MNESVNILVECPDLIASVRVGVLEPLSPLMKAGKCNVVFKKTMDIQKDDIKWCDILITVRGFEHVTLEIVKSARKAGRFIIYFLDDDLLNLPEDIPGGKWFQIPEVRQTMISVINNSDRLWCVNPLLGEKYKAYCNWGKYALGKVPVEIAKPVEKQTSNIVRILYAGSSDHSDLIQKYISPAVRSLCQEYGDELEFTFIGANPAIIDLNNVKFIDFINDYNEYKEIVCSGKYDIGLAVVAEDEFYKYKYYNKFIEYTAIDVVGVYSKREPYTLIVEDKINGFLCDNDDWYIVLKEAIESRYKRETCISNAKKILIEEYNYYKVSEELKESIPELTRYHAVKSNKVRLISTRAIFYKYRWLTYWNRYHVFAAPILALKVMKKIVRKLRISTDKYKNYGVMK